MTAPANTAELIAAREVVAEWLVIVEKAPISPRVLRYPPICQSEINAIRIVLEALADCRAEIETLARQALLDAMSEASEDRWAAGWMSGCEITFWREINDPEYAHLLKLSHQANGWPSSYPHDQDFRWLTLDEAAQALGVAS